MWRQPKDLYNPEYLVPTMKGSCGPMVFWGGFSLNGLGAVIPFEGTVNADHDLIELSDHSHPMLQHLFPVGKGVFQDDTSPILRARVVAQWFDEHDTDVLHMP